MADLMEVQPRTYQNYESVTNPRVPFRRMNDIARITGRPTEWLLHGETGALEEPGHRRRLGLNTSNGSWNRSSGSSTLSWAAGSAPPRPRLRLVR